MKHLNLEELIYHSFLDCENITELNSEMNTIRKKHCLPEPKEPEPENENQDTENKQQQIEFEFKRPGAKSKQFNDIDEPLRTIGFHNEPGQSIFRFKPKMKQLSRKVNAYPLMTAQIIINRYWTALNKGEKGFADIILESQNPGVLSVNKFDCINEFSQLALERQIDVLKKLIEDDGIPETSIRNAWSVIEILYKHLKHIYSKVADHSVHPKEDEIILFEIVSRMKYRIMVSTYLEHYDSTECNIQMRLKDLFKERKTLLDKAQMARSFKVDCPDMLSGDCVKQLLDIGNIKNGTCFCSSITRTQLQIIDRHFSKSKRTTIERNAIFQSITQFIKNEDDLKEIEIIPRQEGQIKYCKTTVNFRSIVELQEERLQEIELIKNDLINCSQQFMKSTEYEKPTKKRKYKDTIDDCTWDMLPVSQYAIYIYTGLLNDLKLLKLQNHRFMSMLNSQTLDTMICQFIRNSLPLLSPRGRITYRTTPPNARKNINNSLICLPNLEKFARTTLYPQTLSCRTNAASRHDKLIRNGQRKVNIRLGNIVQSAKQNYPIESRKDHDNRELYELKSKNNNLYRKKNGASIIEFDYLTHNYAMPYNTENKESRAKIKATERKKSTKNKSSTKFKSTPARKYPIAILPQINPHHLYNANTIMKNQSKYPVHGNPLFINVAQQQRNISNHAKPYRSSPQLLKSPHQHQIVDVSDETRKHMANMREYMKKNPIDKDKNLNTFNNTIPSTFIATTQCVEIKDIPNQMLKSRENTDKINIQPKKLDDKPKQNTYDKIKTDKTKLSHDTIQSVPFTSILPNKNVPTLAISQVKENKDPIATDEALAVQETTVITSEGVACIDFPNRGTKRKGRPTISELWNKEKILASKRQDLGKSKQTILHNNKSDNSSGNSNMQTPFKVSVLGNSASNTNKEVLYTDDDKNQKSITNNLPGHVYPNSQSTNIANINPVQVSIVRPTLYPNVFVPGGLAVRPNIVQKVINKPNLKISGPRCNTKTSDVSIRSLQLFNSIQDALTNNNALTRPTEITVEYIDTPTTRNPEQNIPTNEPEDNTQVAQTKDGVKDTTETNNLTDNINNANPSQAVILNNASVIRNPPLCNENQLQNSSQNCPISHTNNQPVRSNTPLILFSPITPKNPQEPTLDKSKE